jgi:hypothetical protein
VLLLPAIVCKLHYNQLHNLWILAYVSHKWFNF